MSVRSAAAQTTVAAPLAITSGGPSLGLQRQCACGGSAGLTGACQDCQKKKLVGKPLQTKLRINEPGDQCEQEADRVAEQVMRMPETEISGPRSPSWSPLVQRWAAGGGTGLMEAPPSVHEVLSSQGQPLGADTRAFFEPRFGHDFSRVRVHTDERAEQSARDVNAYAYTVGHNIVFGAGRFAQGMHEGQRLLAHELTHVVQQSGGDEISAGQDNEKRGLSSSRLPLRRGGYNPSSRAVQRQLAEDLEPYQIEGGRYTPKEKKYAAQNPAGLLLTTSVVGKYENQLSSHAPWPIRVSKEWMRFEAGRLGEFVSDYNDFTQYFGEVLHGIGRLRDLLSAGAPEFPTEMTADQKRALRPTDNTQSTVVKKQAFRDWRKAQAEYATTYTTEGSVLTGGLAFDVAQTGRDFDLARQEFWQAKGKLSRTIAASKRLDKPKYEALELKFSDALALLDPLVAAGVLMDKVQDARQRRKEYDTKIKEFGEAVKVANDSVRDDFEAFKGAETIYWAKLAEHQKSIQERDKARIESRQRAGILGQATADRSETRDPVLAELRMPELVADAWHALATIGPPASKKLREVLAGRGVVERASHTDLSWRGHDPYGLSEIKEIRLAWERALSWKDVLTRENVEEWVAVDELWEETFVKFNV